MDTADHRDHTAPDTFPRGPDRAVCDLEAALGDLTRAASDPARAAELERTFPHLWAAKIRLDNLFETLRRQLAYGLDGEPW